MGSDLKYQILEIFYGNISANCGVYQDVNAAIFECEELNKCAISQCRYIVKVVYL